MTENRKETGELRASVAAILEEYSSLGVNLTPHQILLQLVARGLLDDTSDDYDNLLALMLDENGGMSVELQRHERLNSLKDAVLKAEDRFQRGEPNLLEDIEAILRHALDERAQT